MNSSTRNKFSGKIVGLTRGGLMCTVEVQLDGGGDVIVASMLSEMFDELGLAPGGRTVVMVEPLDIVLAAEE